MQIWSKWCGALPYFTVLSIVCAASTVSAVAQPVRFAEIFNLM